MTITISGTTGIAGVDGSAATPSVQGADTNTGMFFPAVDTIAFAEGGTEVMRLDSSANLQFNSGYGSVATAYGCRAWVNFNGTTNVGGFCTTRGSGNVTSVADNGLGDYTVNFMTAMPDANYSWSIAADRTTSPIAQITSGTATPAPSNLRVMTYNTSLVAADSAFVAVNIFR